MSQQTAKRAQGVPINPKLPRGFFHTANESRPLSHERWWDVPFIQTEICEENASSERRASWLKAWPTGTRFDVRCLDGGAHDRPTCWGMFATLQEAVDCALSGPSWMKGGAS